MSPGPELGPRPLVPRRRWPGAPRAGLRWRLAASAGTTPRLSGLVRRPRFVVEDSDSPIWVASYVVLEGEMGTRPEGEVVAFTTQAPQHGAAATVQLVTGPGVTGRHDQVAISGVDIDRVDVEIVPGGSTV